MYMILNQSMTINRIVKWFYLVLMFLILSPSAVNMSRKNSKHGPAIDEGHFKRFPDCGKMPKKSSSRIINSQKAEVHYPWVVQVRRYWKGKEIGVCGGTIITKRAVLTSGHCVCGNYEKEGIYKWPLCLPDMQNQITDNNTVLIISGDNRKRKYVNLGIFKIAIKLGATNEVEDARIKYIDVKANRPQNVLYDIAVLKSTKDIYKSGDAKRAPICLGALNAKVDNNQKITTVGWGLTYDEYPPRDPDVTFQPRNPMSTTCSTNKYGPTANRFQSCDVKFLKDNKWSCKKIMSIKWGPPRRNELPNLKSRPIYDFNKCENIFSKAKSLIGNLKTNSEIKWTNNLGEIKNLVIFGDIVLNKRIRKEGSLRKNIMRSKVIHCYEKELFEKYGWCKVSKGKPYQQHDAWGFCDTSCEGAGTYWKDFGASLPNRYHEMTWRIKNPSKRKPKDCGFETENLKLSYIYCIENIFPKTPTVFLEIKNGKLEVLPNGFTIEGMDSMTVQQQKNIGAQRTGRGDSGTGHWIINTATIPHKAVLIAISSLNKRQVQITTDKNILNFIKTTLSNFKEL